MMQNTEENVQSAEEKCESTEECAQNEGTEIAEEVSGEKAKEPETDVEPVVAQGTVAVVTEQAVEAAELPAAEGTAEPPAAVEEAEPSAAVEDTEISVAEEKKKFDMEKVTVPLRSAGKWIWRHTKRLAKAGFRRLHRLYCRNICTYSNVVLIGAAVLLCFTGAFSQAVFGILVVLHLFLSVHADRKEKKRICGELQAETVQMEKSGQPEETAQAREKQGQSEETAQIRERSGEQEEEEVTIRARKSRLERSMDAYGRRIGAVMLVLSLTLFVQSFLFRYEPFRTGVLSMCSAFVAAMPIGLYLLKWLADYIGAVRISKKGMRVQEKRSVEQLSEMDVLLIGHSSMLTGAGTLHKPGVRTILISGETPEELSAVIRAAELSGECSLDGLPSAEAKWGGDILDAATLHNMDEMRKAVLRSSVISNATPFQKGVFVNLLQESGKVVAVAGENEDDCTAIREADISVSFAKKEEKAAQLSDMVSENGGLDVLWEAYEESSAVNGSLQKLSSLFFMKNISALLLALYAAICSVPYPVTLSMWFLISIFTIGLPAVVLLFCEKKERTETFLFDSVKGSVRTAVTGVLSVLVLFYYGTVFGLEAESVITAGVFLLTFAGFLKLGEYCQPCTMLQVLLIAVCAVGFLFCFAFLKPMFGLAVMGKKVCLLLVLFLIAEETVYRILRFISRKVRENQS